MTDVNAEQTPEPTTPVAEPVAEPTGADLRKAAEEHPAFRSAVKKAAALEAKLAEMEAAQKAREEQRLQEQGEFKTLAEQRAAEIAAIKAQHERELLTRDADLALVSAGFGHPILRRGYVAEYLSLPQSERPSLSEWAEKIKADPVNAPIVSAQQAPPVGGGPTGGAAPRAGNGNGTINKADLFSRDPNKVAAFMSAAIAETRKNLGR